jgi:hypothetical protein
MNQVFTCYRCGASTDHDLEYGVCPECPVIDTIRDRLQRAIRKTAFEVFKGINETERSVFADEIAAAITGDLYTRALLRAVAAGREGAE